MDQKILSFDIGTKHLAWCQAHMDMSTRDINVIDWQLVDINAPTIEMCLQRCLELFKTRFADMSGTIVLIERQIYMNLKAYTLSHFIHGYFAGKKQKVIYMSAKSKPLQKQGQARKTEAVHMVSKMIRDSERTFIENHKKKDDLADCYLQIVGHSLGKS